MSTYDDPTQNRSDAQTGPQARYVPLGRDDAHDVHVVYSNQTQTVHVVARGGFHRTEAFDGDLDAYVRDVLPAFADEWVREYNRLTAGSMEA